MKKTSLFAGIFFLVALASCTSNNKKQFESKDTADQVAPDSTTNEHIDHEHNSQNSLDWNGTYKGVYPCADCPGIETTVVLNNDGTFSYTGVYQERDTKIEDTGKFMWHDNGSVVHLMGKEVNMKLRVGENQLISLDQDGKPIEGPLKDHYVLKKQN